MPRDAIEQLTTALRSLLKVEDSDGSPILRELFEDDGYHTFCNVCGDVDDHKDWCAVGLAERVLRLVHIETVASNQPAVADEDVEPRDATRQMAEQGDARAQFTVGEIYSAGWVADLEKGLPRSDERQGVPQDFTQAAAWYRKAADQGYAPVQSALASIFYVGKGVPQDFTQAAAWYRKLADQGQSSGQFNLGNMYEEGVGVPQDYVEAYKWHSLAAAHAPSDDFGEGWDWPEELERCETLAQKMTPQQVAEAQKRASEWLADFERRHK